MANRDFDKLLIDEQVEFINSQLEKDKKLSLRKVCEKFGINRNTIGSRFKNKGYNYDPYEKKYKKDTKILNEKENNINDNAVKEIMAANAKYKTNTKVLVKNENNDNVDELKETLVIKNEKYKSNELVFLHDMEKKKNDLLELLELKEDIKRLIQNHDKNIISLDPIELKIDKDILKGDTVNRSIKMYEVVYKELQELYTMYPQFKKYDIVSEAIHEFYLRYKK